MFGLASAAHRAEDSAAAAEQRRSRRVLPLDGRHARASQRERARPARHPQRRHGRLGQQSRGASSGDHRLRVLVRGRGVRGDGGSAARFAAARLRPAAWRRGGAVDAAVFSGRAQFADPHRVGFAWPNGGAAIARERQLAGRHAGAGRARPRQPGHSHQERDIPRVVRAPRRRQRRRAVHSDGPAVRTDRAGGRSTGHDSADRRRCSSIACAGSIRFSSRC